MDENPFLYDHMIGEHPVLPATCAAAWAAYTCEQLYPGYHFFSLENYRVLKGIVFDDSLADEHVLDLKEVAKSEEKIVFDALVWSKNKKGRHIYHYSLRVTLMRDLPVPPVFHLESGVDRRRHLWQPALPGRHALPRAFVPGRGTRAAPQPR